MVFDTLAETAWFIFPAYFANMVPVMFCSNKFVKSFNIPVDFGKTFQGNPLLGPGKTWIGLFLGILGGTFMGFLQGLVPFEPLSSVKLGFVLGSGAIFGDLAGSFIKRRLNIKRGKKAIFLDQLDFVLGAFLFAWLFGAFDFTYFILALVATPYIHLSVNLIAYKLKFKNEPW